MISYHDFEDALKEVSELTGTPVKKTTVAALYKILNGVNSGDFKKGIADFAESGDRFNLFALRKHINLAMSERIGKEHLIMKKWEEQETHQFWLAHFKEGKCIKHECGKCPKDFCVIVSNACIKAITKMMSGDISGVEMHKELASKFPGIGFEQYAGIEPF